MKKNLFLFGVSVFTCFSLSIASTQASPMQSVSPIHGMVADEYGAGYSDALRDIQQLQYLVDQGGMTADDALRRLESFRATALLRTTDAGYTPQEQQYYLGYYDGSFSLSDPGGAY